MPTGFLQNNCSKQWLKLPVRCARVIEKDFTIDVFFHKKLRKAKIKTLEGKKFFLECRCQCWDFQMALNLFNVGQIYIIHQKIKQLALQINLQCKSNFFELRELYSVKRDFWNGELKLRFVNPLKGNWYNISGRMHVHSADEYGNWGPRAGGWINPIARHMIWCSLFDPLFPLAHLILASSFARLLRHCNYLISSQKMRIVAYISNWPPKLYHEKGKYRLNRH